jgi:cyanate lyase
MLKMQKIPSTRLDWLKHYCLEKQLVNSRGEAGSAELAAKIDRSQNYCSQLLLGKKSFGEDIARHIEEKLNLLKWDLDGGAGWPFKGIDRRSFDELTYDQKMEIQGLARKAIQDFEATVGNKRRA